MQPLNTQKLTVCLAVFSLLGAEMTLAESAISPAPYQAQDKEKEKDKSKGDKDKSDKGKGKGDKDEGGKRVNDDKSKAADKDQKSEKKGGDSRTADATTIGGNVECAVRRATSGLSGVAEASGIAASRRTPGILWSHGDSYVGEPHLFAFDANGAAKGRVRLAGVKVADWEAIAVGPCGGSTCVFVGDIGDNEGARKNITIHRIPEPLPTDPTAGAATTFHATYPDGPNDAEAMFVSSSGEIFVITKGETGPIALYRFGSAPKAFGTTVLQKVALLQSGRIARNQWVTGASASPDGKWVAMRTHGAAYFYDTDRLIKGDAKSPMKFDATSLKEPQGEGISLGPDGALFLAGEGGGKGAAGTLSGGTCKLPTATQATP